MDKQTMLENLDFNGFARSLVEFNKEQFPKAGNKGQGKRFNSRFLAVFEFFA